MATARVTDGVVDTSRADTRDGRVEDEDPRGADGNGNGNVEDGDQGEGKSREEGEVGGVVVASSLLERMGLSTRPVRIRGRVGSRMRIHEEGMGMGM